MADNDGKPTVAAPEQRITEQAEDLAAITSEFRHFTYPPAEGKQGQELFQAFYADPKLGYMAQQVLKAVRDWGNFKPGSAGSSRFSSGTWRGSMPRTSRMRGRSGRTTKLPPSSAGPSGSRRMASRRRGPRTRPRTSLIENEKA